MHGVFHIYIFKIPESIQSDNNVQMRLESIISKKRDTSDSGEWLFNHSNVGFLNQSSSS